MTWVYRPLQRSIGLAREVQWLMGGLKCSPLVAFLSTPLGHFSLCDVGMLAKGRGKDIGASPWWVESSVQPLPLSFSLTTAFPSPPNYPANLHYPGFPGLHLPQEAYISLYLGECRGAMERRRFMRGESKLVMSLKASFNQLGAASALYCIGFSISAALC